MVISLKIPLCLVILVGRGLTKIDMALSAYDCDAGIVSHSSSECLYPLACGSESDYPCAGRTNSDRAGVIQGFPSTSAVFSISMSRIPLQARAQSTIRVRTSMPPSREIQSPPYESEHAWNSTTSPVDTWLETWRACARVRGGAGAMTTWGAVVQREGGGERDQSFSFFAFTPAGRLGFSLSALSSLFLPWFEGRLNRFVLSWRG